MERTDAHVTIQLYTPSSDLWPEETISSCDDDIKKWGLETK